MGTPKGYSSFNIRTHYIAGTLAGVPSEMANYVLSVLLVVLLVCTSVSVY